MNVLSIYTLTLHVLTLKHISQKVVCFFCLMKHLTNSVDPDQTAPIGAV